MPSDEPYYRRSAPLDRNQAELLALMARGWSNSQIAASLDAPLPLVKSEVSRIIAALGASSREEAIEIWTHRRRRFSKSPALRGVLGVGIAGTFSVLAVAALVRGTSHVPQQPPELQGEAEEQVVGPPPATAPPLAHTAYCPSADPATASYPWASAYDWIGFDGVTYVRQTQLAGSGPGKVAPSAVGQIYGLVNVDCPGTFLAPGQPLRTVGGYAPAFRLATEDGVIYEAVSREFADSVAGYFDLSSRVAAIVVRDPQNGAELGRIDDSPSVASLVRLFLDSEPTATEVPLDVVLLSFELFDGTTFTRPYYPSARVVWPDIRLSSRFNDALLVAMAR